MTTITERTRRMPSIIVQAVNADGEPRRWTLIERIASANLDSAHYRAPLVQRLAWATADAEALEAPGRNRRSPGNAPGVRSAAPR
jgi:hypothetical protein